MPKIKITITNLMFRPCGSHFIEQRRVRTLRETADRIEEMRGQLFGNAFVQERPMFVKDQIIGIPVQLFKGELGGVSVVNLVDRIRQNFPGLRGNRSVHWDMRPERLWLLLWFAVDEQKIVRRRR